MRTIKNSVSNACNSAPINRSVLIAFLLLLTTIPLRGYAQPTLSITTRSAPDIREMPAGDYPVPESQVFVAGKATKSYATILGGIPIGMGLDKSKNAAAISPVAGALRIRFDKTFEEKLRALKPTNASAEPYQFLEGSKAAELSMAPVARLYLLDDDTARLSFQVISDDENAIPPRRKRMRYFYVLSGTKKMTDGMEGWTDQSSKLFLAAADKAFAALAAVIAADLKGEMPVPTENRSVVIWKPDGNDEVRAILVKEFPNFVVQAPGSNDKPTPGVLSIVERPLVREIKRLN